MRKIKFRVYNTKTKSWIHAPNKEVNLFGEMILMGHFLDGVSIRDLNDCVALQFTGLKDSNDVELYEGDIVKTVLDDSLEDYEAEIDQIVYKNGSFVLKNALHMKFLEEYMIDGKLFSEIIGNIFENPQLLN